MARTWGKAQATVSSFASPAYPEHVHAGEDIWMLPFERMPVGEVRHRGVGGKALAIMRGHVVLDLKSDQSEAFGVQEGFDLRQGHPLLGDVEQEIAAVAGAVEIAQFSEVRQIGGLLGHEFLATSPNVRRRRAIAALRNETPRRDHRLAGGFAIKPQMQFLYQD